MAEATSIAPVSRLSVVIPVWNEAGAIGMLVQFIRQHGGTALKEIIVVDGGSTDQTVAEAESAGAKVLKSARGRAVQLNSGAEHASGDLLWFVHADVHLPETFVSDILGSLAQGFDAGCYRYRFDANSRLLKMNAWFTRFPAFCFGDQTLFLSRDLFDRLGGFDEKYVIMEDREFLRRLLKSSHFVILPKEIIVSARKYSSNSWLRVQLVNGLAFSMFRLGARPTLIRQLYTRFLNPYKN